MRWEIDVEDGRTMSERWLAGDPYRADAAIEESCARAARLCRSYDDVDPADGAGARTVLVELLERVGEGTTLRPPIRFDHGHRTRFGARCFANFGLVVLDVAPVVVGDDVQIGPGVQLLTPTHPLDAEQRAEGWESAEPITIEDGVWLGGGVVVLPGVTIGARTVVGAGSVVSRDLPPDVLAMGSPARVVKQLGTRSV